MRAALAIPAAVGRGTLGLFRTTGKITLVLGRTLRALPRMRLGELIRGGAYFGTDSIALTLAVAVLAGTTVIVQTGIYVEHFGVRRYMGYAAGYSVLWEFGPLFVGLMLAARAGARNAAELGTLQVGGQLEGLRGISLDPYAVLIAPRVVSLAIGVSLLSALAFLVAIITEAAASRIFLDLDWGVFEANLSTFLGWRDLIAGEVKAGVFGLAIALISTAAGISAEGGARAVGRAASAAVVYSCGAIFGLDLVLTAVLTRWLK
jgi:phospholipid/cholesterol/gamma-HCH transport system permease protein